MSTELTDAECDALIRQAFPLTKASAAYRKLVRLAARSADTSALWQAIETAPKDGTRIMLAAAPDRVTLGCWMVPSEVPWLKYRDGYAPEEVWDEFDPWWHSEDGGFTDEHPPTHWMPLPEPPPAAPGGPAGARRPDDHSEVAR